MKRKILSLAAVCCMVLFLMGCACGEDMGNTDATPSPAATQQPTGTPTPMPTKAPTSVPSQDNGSDLNGAGSTNSDNGIINDIGNGVGDVMDGLGTGVNDVMDGIGNGVEDMTGGNGTNSNNSGMGNGSAAGGAR